MQFFPDTPISKTWRLAIEREVNNLYGPPIVMIDLFYDADFRPQAARVCLGRYRRALLLDGNARFILGEVFHRLVDQSTLHDVFYFPGNE